MTSHLVHHQKPILARISPLIDLLLVYLFAYFSPQIADAIGPLIGWEEVGKFSILNASPFVAGAAVGAVPFILSLVGFYHRNSLQRISSAVRQVLTFTVYFLCAIAFYQSRGDHPTYMNHVIMVNMVGIPLLIFLRYLVLHYLMLSGLLGRSSLSRILLIGERDDIEKGWSKLPKYWKRTLAEPFFAYRGEDRADDIQTLIERHHITQAMLFGGLNAYHENEDAVTLCELQGIDVYVNLLPNHAVRLRAAIDSIGEQRMLILSSAPEYSWQFMIKSITDRLVAAAILLASSPLWLIAAIGIKISDPKGPVFYKQMRSGRYGHPFGMWKFRSMYSDADARLDEIKAQYGNEMEGPIFKLTNDPRIIPFGHFLRKTSIDELPQLINVLLGQMSVVGPRPLPLYETAEFPEVGNRRRLSVKPGLTCYWQVEDRSNAHGFSSMVEKDLKYIDNWSLWLDLTLFLRTIPAVLFRRGAK